MEVALNNLFEDEETIEDTRKFSKLLVSGVKGNKDELDKKINDISKNWKFDRISPVDKAIIRLALYELSCEKDTPPAVIINEAIELAKRYSDENSARFINGILGAAVV